MDFLRNIRAGMSGDDNSDVMAVKNRLFALGFYSLKITEIKSHTYGSDSVLAAKRFQLKNGLVADGIVGRLTWAALFGDPINDETSAEVKSEKVAAMKILWDECIANKSRYVWAMEGQLGINVTEDFIRKMEQRCNNGENADRAVDAWREQIEAGNTEFRVGDCSGAVSFILNKCGVIAGRRNCDRLWDLCDKISEPIDGAFLFRVNKKNAEDETHVGMFFDGLQYHSKGRSDGWICEPYDPSYWHKIGWFKALPKG